MDVIYFFFFSICVIMGKAWKFNWRKKWRKNCCLLCCLPCCYWRRWLSAFLQTRMGTAAGAITTSMAVGSPVKQAGEITSCSGTNPPGTTSWEKAPKPRSLKNIQRADYRWNAASTAHQSQWPLQLMRVPHVNIRREILVFRNVGVLKVQFPNMTDVMFVIAKRNIRTFL